MLKLMIVDDEAVIRNGIRYSIPWSQLGIEVVAEAGNGLDAVEKAIAVQPDIVITDIKMPVLDGIEFIKHVKDKLAHTQFILLSGYSDTEYLKKAISIGVSDYIFKNANSQEIIDAVNKVKVNIERDNQIRRRFIQRDNLLDENMSVIYSTLMRHILVEDTNTPAQDYYDKIDDLGITLAGPCFAIVGLPYQANNEWAIISCLNQQFKQQQPFICAMEGTHIVAIINLKQQEDYQDLFLQARQSCNGIISQNTTMVVSPICKNISDLKKGYLFLQNTIEVLFWFSNKPLVFAEETFVKPISRAELIAIEGRCITAFISKNSNKMRMELYDYFKFLENNLVPRKKFLESITRLLSSICAFDQNDGILEFLSEIENCGYEEIFSHIQQQILEDDQSANNNTILIQKLQEYIDEHLLENLSLIDLSKRLYISPSYLSRLFKEKNRMGFKDYVYGRRIEKAKELLLKPNLKIGEIATMTGFRDYKHFSNVFLKTCGFSARDYRTHHIREQFPNNQ
ncbi:MAG: response regulator [Oscillospiraceae bacterium]